jgi:cystathionine beta-lyase/cystathionine gamma-synthase
VGRRRRPVLEALRQSDSALKIARHLEAHDRIEQIFYPGLESHPQHAVAKRQMKAFGGILSFLIKGGFEAA